MRPVFAKPSAKTPGPTFLGAPTDERRVMPGSQS
jgi:hypothetical protein